MILTLILIVILAVIVLGFVLEPVIRSRPDKVIIESINLPEPPPGIIQAQADADAATATDPSERASAGEPQPDNSPAKGNT